MIAISAADNFKLQTRRKDHRCRPQLLDIFNDRAHRELID